MCVCGVSLSLSLTRVDGPLALSLPSLNASLFPLGGVLLGQDVAHRVFPLGQLLVVDGGDFEPVAVDNVLFLSTGESFLDYHDTTGFFI